jgi:hypothetical protein
MKFIILKNQYQQDVIVNLANVSIFFSKSETETTICFQNPDDYIVCDISINVFHKGLNAINDSANVWDFRLY